MSCLDIHQLEMGTCMAIHVVANGGNSQGDLFNERMKDIVLALGYEVIRTNIHKPGREIDIIAKHTIEERRAVVECKAKKEKIGGGDINKFIGALDAERQGNENLSGFFISVSGFTDSAIEQEAATGRRRVSLLGPTEIEQQLLRGRVIVSREKAFFKAGMQNSSSPSWKIDSEADLVAHQSGWLWLVYFTEGGQRRGYTLIHADGHFPAERIGQQIAKNIKARISEHLQYLPGADEDAFGSLESDREAYLQYVLGECGEFTLEGFPVDQHLGSKSIELENLYVPQYLEPVSDESQPDESGSSNTRKERQSLSEILTDCRAFTVLGPPGAGKSTLVKRLATSYAATDRMARIADGLPEVQRLPLVLRCREIQNHSAPLIDIIREIPRRAEISFIEGRFAALVEKSVRNGEALVLIDGLDEFPTTSDRARFLRQLRTFMMRYPLCTVIVTSRETGFREVAGSLSEGFAKYRISELRDDEIIDLTTSWHRQIYGEDRATLERSTLLAHKIIATDRVRRLAVNPLLLTTLLLVQRWVGDLPRKRSVLYGKAIELLLMTWNVEGHDPLDLDEVKPHLAYLAHSMTVLGKQRIRHDEMLSIFRDARRDLPDVLGYCTTSPQELLRRIEFRSSLLSLTGHAIHDGTLRPIYEFKHLTFQEYLAAVAVVQGWYKDAAPEEGSFEAIKMHVRDPHWHEIASLYGVLAGRGGKQLIEFLCEVAEEYDDRQEGSEENERDTLEEDEHNPMRFLLIQCLIDEVQAPPDLATRALELVVPYAEEEDFDGLLTSRYANQLLKLADESVSDPFNGDTPFVGVLARRLLLELPRPLAREELVEILRAHICGDDLRNRVGALGALMSLAYWVRNGEDELERLGLDKQVTAEVAKECADDALRCAGDRNAVVRFAALWALAWIGESLIPTQDRQDQLFHRFTDIYFNDPDDGVQRMAGWCLMSVCRDSDPPHVDLTPKQTEFLHRWLDVPVREPNWISHGTKAAMLFAAVSNDPSMREKVQKIIDTVRHDSEQVKRFVRLMRMRG
ncbi:restriction endonuclease [Streptomyces sp. NPDC058467]|uniref:restriction endonuclease n=1 Tax=Streptomyces sp. NPDC058467 TaxID=3346513 RepID=UPI00366681AC